MVQWHELVMQRMDFDDDSILQSSYRVDLKSFPLLQCSPSQGGSEGLFRAKHSIATYSDHLMQAGVCLFSHFHQWVKRPPWMKAKVAFLWWIETLKRRSSALIFLPQKMRCASEITLIIFLPYLHRLEHKIILKVHGFLSVKTKFWKWRRTPQRSSNIRQ